MLNLNRVTIAGNLGGDPDIRKAGDKDVCTITVATNEYRGKGNDREQFTEWHRVVLWGQFARFAAEHLHKGSSVYVEGRLQTRKWEDQEGVERYTTEVVALDFQSLSGKPHETQGAQPDEGRKATRSRWSK